jgi:hypothetical protein
MNKKAIGFLSIFSLLISLSIVPAYSATKAGAKCTKVGIKSVVGNKTFTCIKSGKKLVWNKGKTSVAIPAQVIPDSWPIDKSADKNIFLIADKNIRKFQTSTKSPAKVIVNYGPTVEKNRADQHLNSMFEASKFWSTDWNFDKEITVAIGTSKDYTWMRGFWSTFGLLRPEFDSSEKTYTSQGEYCNQGGAIFGDSQPFFWGCLSTQGSLDRYGIAGKKFASHEYTHLAQYGIMTNLGARNMPTLFMEGSAEFYGVTLASTPDKISKDWQEFLSGGYFSESARDYVRSASSDQIYELLIDSYNKGNKYQGHWYYTGAYVTLRMIAAQGHEGFVNFMKSVKETSNAGQSFEKIYGIKFDDFAKIIAPEIGALAKTIKSR